MGNCLRFNLLEFSNNRLNLKVMSNILWGKYSLKQSSQKVLLKNRNFVTNGFQNSLSYKKCAWVKQNNSILFK